MHHHVYFWLKADQKTDASRAELEKGLQLCCDVSSVATGGWGQQAATPARPVTDKTWDYSLYLTFNTVEDHNAYQIDPNHDIFVAENKHRWEKVVVMDVE